MVSIAAQDDGTIFKCNNSNVISNLSQSLYPEGSFIIQIVKRVVS